MSAWTIYDDLIEKIPDDLTVKSCVSGHTWTLVTSSEDGIGVSMTIPLFTKPFTEGLSVIGMPLKQVAGMVKSWNFIEAAMGMAAINAYYNVPHRAEKCGVNYISDSTDSRDAFHLYSKAVTGKKVAVVGHFPYLETCFAPVCELSILEREPHMGDYPDTAAEYILPEQDYIFVTGSTFVNKTFPRILELGKQAKIVIVGPSTPLSPVLLEHGVYGLSGMLLQDVATCNRIFQEGNTGLLFKAGEMVDYVNPTFEIK